jgi:hypothetical protein
VEVVEFGAVHTYPLLAHLFQRAAACDQASRCRS